MLSEPMAELLEKLWPAIDPERVHSAGDRLSEVVQRLSELQRALAEVARDLDSSGAGEAVTAMSAHARRITDVELASVTDRVGHHAGTTHAYGDAVADTQERLTVVAAIADRDLLAGRVLATATGDTTTLTVAHDTGARVMAAAAGQLDWRTGAITHELAARSDTDSDHGQSGAGGAPMMAPMGGALAGVMAGALTHARGPDHQPESEVADGDLAMLRSRAAHLTSIQPAEVAPWIRLAVGLGAAGDGRHVVVVGTSEWGGYLRPGTTLEPHEVVVGDGRAPELAIMDYFSHRDIEPLAVCASTPAPPEVVAEIAGSGAQSVGVDDDQDNPGP